MRVSSYPRLVPSWLPLRSDTDALAHESSSDSTMLSISTSSALSMKSSAKTRPVLLFVLRWREKLEEHLFPGPCRVIAHRSKYEGGAVEAEKEHTGE